MRGEGLAERVEVLGRQREAGGGAVPAEALEVLGAGLKRRVQIEAGDAAAAAPTAALAVERDDHDRTVMALDQPRGDDPDHTGVPVVAGDDQAKCLAQGSGRSRRAASAAVSTSRSRARRSELARLSSAAISSARASSSVSSNSTPASAR